MPSSDQIRAKLGLGPRPKPMFGHNRSHALNATRKISKPNLDPWEFLKTEIMSFSKLIKLSLSGKIVDSITLSSILSFAIKQKLI